MSIVPMPVTEHGCILAKVGVAHVKVPYTLADLCPPQVSFWMRRGKGRSGYDA